MATSRRIPIKPRFKQRPSDVIVREGETAVIYCEVVGLHDRCTISFCRNKSQILPLHGPKYDLTVEGEEITFKVKDVSFDDGGRHKVIVSNEYVGVTENFVITVIAAEFEMPTQPCYSQSDQKKAERNDQFSSADTQGADSLSEDFEMLSVSTPLAHPMIRILKIYLSCLSLGTEDTAEDGDTASARPTPWPIVIHTAVNMTQNACCIHGSVGHSLQRIPVLVFEYIQEVNRNQLTDGNASNQVLSLIGQQIQLVCAFNLNGDDPNTYQVNWIVGAQRVLITDPDFQMRNNGEDFVLTVRNTQPFMAGEFTCELSQRDTNIRHHQTGRIVILNNPFIVCHTSVGVNNLTKI